jgi:periplasmic divalent cation tolerance protein
MREEYIQVSTTVDGKDHAERIAKTLLERRLAACVQIVGPVTSAYWWKGKLEKAEEWICLIKSRMGLYEELETAIREIHTYETPEIVVVPIIAGSSRYLRWLEGELKDK